MTRIPLVPKPVAVFTYLGSLLASLVLVFSGGIAHAPWSHQSSWAVSWSASAALLVEVVAAGASAFVSVHIAGSDSIARGRGLPQPIRLPASAAAFVVVPAWAGMLTTTAITYVMVWRNTGQAVLPSTWPLLANALAAVLLTAAAGAAAGTLWPHLFTPIAAGTGVFLISYLGGHRASALLGTAGNSGSLIGMRANSTYVWLALVSLGLLLAGSAAVFTASRTHRPRVRWPAAVVGIGMCLVACLGPARAAADEESVVVDTAAMANACADDDGVRVCVTRDAGLSAADVRRQIAPYVDALRAQRVRVPQTILQSLPAGSGGGRRASFVIDDESLSRGHLTDQGAAAALTTPSQCPQWRSATQAPENAIRARFYLRQWLLTEVGKTPTSTDPVLPQEGAWLASDGAKRWVRATYPLLTSCHLAAVPSPTAFGLDARAAR